MFCQKMMQYKIKDLSSGGGIIEQLARSQEILFLCTPKSHLQQGGMYTF